MEDLVFPKGNEQEMEAMAKKLGIRLRFVYDTAPQKGKKSMQKKELSFFSSRKALKKNALVYGLFETDIKLNQVVCKIAVQQNCTFLFPFAPLLRMHPVVRAKRLGQWMFALRLFKKYNVAVRAVSFARTPLELRSEKQLQAVLDWLR